MQGSSDGTRNGFAIWLRTGRWPDRGTIPAIERKFNPWHDPENGRFTFAGTGRHYGSGGQGRAARPASPPRRRPPLRVIRRADRLGIVPSVAVVPVGHGTREDHLLVRPSPGQNRFLEARLRRLPSFQDRSNRVHPSSLHWRGPSDRQLGGRSNATVTTFHWMRTAIPTGLKSPTSRSTPGRRDRDRRSAMPVSRTGCRRMTAAISLRTASMAPEMPSTISRRTHRSIAESIASSNKSGSMPKPRASPSVWPWT